MTQEEKQLLLVDLCARLPYNYVYCYCNAPLANGKPIILTPVVISNLMNAAEDLVIKPYLRPMSSMTQDERMEMLDYTTSVYRDYHQEESDTVIYQYKLDEYLNWLNQHHFDYRGLISKGLALEAPSDMYK